MSASRSKTKRAGTLPRIPAPRVDLTSRFNTGVARPALTIALARQRRLNPLLLAWFQIERVPFDFFNDVFLEDFALEAPQRVIERFAFLKPYLGQRESPLFHQFNRTHSLIAHNGTRRQCLAAARQDGAACCALLESRILHQREPPPPRREPSRRPPPPN